MIELTGGLLSPLIPIFIILVVIIFAFRKDIPHVNVGKFLIGITFGIVVYAALMYGSRLHESKTTLEIILKILALYDGTILYVWLVAMIGVTTLMSLISKKYVPSAFLAGIVVSFVIFEVYFALRCFETIHFMETLGKSMC